MRGIGAICGRHAAGNNPAKRDQILAGAYAVFTEMGFDAASMNDIARRANVSKGTLYVYFQNKEDLFEALIDTKRDSIFADMDRALDGDGSTAEKLLRYGKGIAKLILSDEVIRAQRIVIAVIERKPELGARFYERGPLKGKQRLKAFLTQEVEAGRLVIDDIELATFQFGELCTAGLSRPRLFGHMPDMPGEKRIAYTVESAARLFMAAYGAPGQHGA